MGSRPLKLASSRWLGREPARENPCREARTPYCDEVKPSGASARSRATRHRNDRCQRRYPVEGGGLSAGDDMASLYLVIVIMYSIAVRTSFVALGPPTLEHPTLTGQEQLHSFGVMMPGRSAATI
jgi:hypothetical protein